MRFQKWSASVLAVLAIAGCASSSTPEAEAPAQSTGAGLTVNILNDHAGAATAVIFIEAVGGVRQSLGTVQAGTSHRFTFAATPGNAYLLVQQTDTGDTRTSDRFTYAPPTTVTWDLNTRRLSVLRR